MLIIILQENQKELNMKDPNIITADQLITEIIECAKRIRRQLGPGFLEKVYKNAMVVELRKLKLNFETEKLIQVLYDGIVVGEYRTDIIVEGKLILELKATQDLSIANEVQLVNYLTSTQIDDGLLINFGADKLQFKRKYRIYRKL